MTKLEQYYNKFNEDHRLKTRHGIVEFTVAMKYIHDFIPDGKKVKILDLGAATGAYSVPLSNEGHFVTAVEPVKRNLKILESKHSLVNCWNADARNLSFLEDNTFDICLIFGPMYHLHSPEERLLVFNEAKRVTKSKGIIFVSYVMNEYSILTYGFKQNHIKEIYESKKITKDFHTIESENELYSYFRLEDINELNKRAGVKRIKILAQDGPSDYMRKELNAMDEESFNLFIEYQLNICERMELLGASSHVLDILEN